MGSFITRLFDGLFGNREIRIVMVGLYGAGKETIMSKLKPGGVVSYCPAIGIRVMTVTCRNFVVTSWNVGERDKRPWTRDIWRLYSRCPQGIIFVVDSDDRERINDAHDELMLLLEEGESHGAALLVLANKQDLPNAMLTAQIAEEMKLSTLTTRKWRVMATCAATGEGLREGIDWLSSVILQEGS